jgi:orotate phosphoribosyltransferase
MNKSNFEIEAGVAVTGAALCAIGAIFHALIPLALGTVLAAVATAHRIYGSKTQNPTATNSKSVSKHGVPA